jgi:hypothetical protein
VTPHRNSGGAAYATDRSALDTVDHHHVWRRLSGADGDLVGHAVSRFVCLLIATPICSATTLYAMPFGKWYDSHFWLLIVAVVAFIVAMNVAVIAMLLL